MKLLPLSLSSLLLITSVLEVSGKTTRYEELAEQSIAAYKSLGDAIKTKAQKPSYLSGVWRMLRRKGKGNNDVQTEFNRMAAELMALNEGDLKAVELLSAECVPPQKGILGFKARLNSNDELLNVPLMQSATTLPICKTVPRALTTLILMRLALVTSHISMELSPLDPPPGYLVRAGVQLDLLKDLPIAADDAPAIRLHKDVLETIEKRLAAVIQAAVDEQAEQDDAASSDLPSTAEPKAVKPADKAVDKGGDDGKTTDAITDKSGDSVTTDAATDKSSDSATDTSTAASTLAPAAGDAPGTISTVVKEIIVPVALPGPGPSFAIPGCGPTSSSDTVVRAKLGLSPESGGGSLSVMAFGG